jgi:hypothetical protein
MDDTMTSEPQMEPESRMVDCVGVDNRRHVCLPEAEACKCGVAVKRKKPLKNDFKLYSCYACTY